MVSLFRFGGFLALAATVLAVNPPKLDSGAANNYELHQQHIQSRYLDDVPLNLRQPIDQYSHYHGAHPNAAAELYDISLEYPYGPAHITFDRTKAYVTTKLPYTHPQSGSWGLNYKEVREDGNALRKELYAFWRLTKGEKPKLLRLDLWPAGAQVYHTLRWHLIL